MEWLSGYGGEFLGEMEKGDVDRIEGLSGGICIDEKRRSKKGGCRVGSVSEMYDYIGLLYGGVGKG